MPTLVETIIEKREGRTHARGDVRRLVRAYGDGELADYQMSAWLMAAFLRGLDEAETLELCDSMLESGMVLDLHDIVTVPGRTPPGIVPAKVDKHSTGGVGDKISLPLAPLVAACGVPVPMVSGRGLGHTGGTLDKLESIAGFRVDLPIDAFRRVLAELGVCMIGQTAEIAPIDKRMYALRDVTGTVESIPLITASILSKKLAEGIDALVLDVKVGRGAFMKSLPSARALAESLVGVARRAGKDVTAFITDMDRPLGRTIGNALEVQESIEVLRGEGPQDVRELTLTLATEMVVLGRVEHDRRRARAVVEEALRSGRALEVFRRLVVAQGGDPAVLDDPSRLPRAPLISIVTSPTSGCVQDLDPLALGLAAVELGAGRTRADQRVDPAVGFVLHATVGDTVEVGQPLVAIHARDAASALAVSDRVGAAFRIGPTSSPCTPLVHEVIRSTVSS